MHAGIKKLREKDNSVEYLEEEVDSDIKVANDISTVVAEDTVSQVLMCYKFLVSWFFMLFLFLWFL